MAGSVFFNANVALDLNGDTSAGAKAYFYQTGTTTPVTVYSDAGLTTPHASPLVADANGRFATVYVSGAVQLKVTVTDADDATLPGYPVDPAIIEGTASTASSVAFAPTVRISSTNIQDAIEEVDAAVAANENAIAASAQIYTTGGTTTAYTITVSGVSSYTANDRYWVRANATNTGAITLNVTGTGAKDVQQYDNAGALAALSAGQFQIGSEYLLHYDGTRFVIIHERLASAADSVWETGTATIPYKATPANIKAAIAAQVADISDQFLHVADIKGSGVAGGTFTSGADRTRTLNTVLHNGITGASLASDLVTLPAGTYYCEGQAPGCEVLGHQAWLYDDTAAANISGLEGTPEWASSGFDGLSRSFIRGRFTLGTSSVLRLYHRCDTTASTYGFGKASTYAGSNKYAELIFWRVA